MHYRATIKWLCEFIFIEIIIIGCFKIKFIITMEEEPISKVTAHLSHQKSSYPKDGSLKS